MSRPKTTYRDPLTPGRLTTAEAAARLGVKKATLYAYVSRGLIGREVAADGRSSLFDASEVEALRRGNRSSDGEVTTVVNTAITRVHEHGLWVRGRPLIELADRDFEEVVEWLWRGEDIETDRIARDWDVPTRAVRSVRKLQAAMPDASTGLDRLRASLALASAQDGLRHDLSTHSVHAAGRTLITLMVEGLGLESSGGAKDQRLADRMWRALTPQKGTRGRRTTLNAAMCLLVDHGLATSNFAARLAGSVRADPYSVVLAGLGVVGGALHGAASSGVHALMWDAHKSGDALRAVGEARRRLGMLPGFGHKVYEEVDPRCESLLGRIRKAWRGDRRLKTIEQVLDATRKRTGKVANIDFALGSLTFLASMDRHAGEVIFAVARSAGWIAHALEEYAEEPTRFRVRARYVGPEVQQS